MGSIFPTEVAFFKTKKTRFEDQIGPFPYYFPFYVLSGAQGPASQKEFDADEECALLTTGLRKAEICSLKVEDLKTYRNQAVVDCIDKGQKFQRIPLRSAISKACLTMFTAIGSIQAMGNG